MLRAFSFLRPLASDFLSSRLLRCRILRSRLRAACLRRLHLPLSTAPSWPFLRPRVCAFVYAPAYYAFSTPLSSSKCTLLSTAVVYPSSFVSPPPLYPIRAFIYATGHRLLLRRRFPCNLSMPSSTPLCLPSISATIYPFVAVSPPRLPLCPGLLQVFVYSVSSTARCRLRYHLSFWCYLQHRCHPLHCHRRPLSSAPSSLFTKVTVVQLAPNAVVWAKAVYLAGSKIHPTYCIASVPPTTSVRSRSSSGRGLAYRDLSSRSIGPTMTGLFH
jgi:hypothetical protein